jgi:membrane dipeptidase
MNDEMLKAVKKNGGVVQLCLLDDYIKKMPPNLEREEALRPFQEKIAARRRGELSQQEADSLRSILQEINVKYPPNRPTVHDAVDHIDHMVKVMGVDHLGIGSDFDGGGGLMGINDVSEMPTLTAELLKRGYSEKDIRKIWGGNLMRVFKEAIQVANKLQREAATSE